MSIINASAYTVGALFLNDLGQAFKPFLTGSVLLQGNMLQLQYAEPGGFTVDNINTWRKCSTKPVTLWKR